MKVCPPSSSRAWLTFLGLAQKPVTMPSFWRILILHRTASSTISRPTLWHITSSSDATFFSRYDSGSSARRTQRSRSGSSLCLCSMSALTQSITASYTRLSSSTSSSSLRISSLTLSLGRLRKSSVLKRVAKSARHILHDSSYSLWH